jgi:hypothetical protein
MYVFSRNNNSSGNVLGNFSGHQRAFFVTGRRIVEIHHFIRGILDFPHHELFSCAGNHVHLVKELRHGFSSTFILRCNMCNVSHRVSSESSEHTEVVLIPRLWQVLLL